MVRLERGSELINPNQHNQFATLTLIRHAANKHLVHYGGPGGSSGSLVLGLQSPTVEARVLGPSHSAVRLLPFQR